MAYDAKKFDSNLHDGVRVATPDEAEEIKASNTQIKDGIKDFFSAFVPKKK